MYRNVIVVDVESTGLDWDVHEIWEIGAIKLGPGYARSEHMWRVKPDLRAAEPEALKVNDYWRQTARMADGPPGVVADLAGLDPGTWLWSDPAALANRLVAYLAQATIVGANPTFDAGFMKAFLRERGLGVPWHYRVRDVQSIAWGWLQGRRHARDPIPPVLPDLDASTDVFAQALGIDPASYDRHSTLGDCRLVADMLDVMARLDSGIPPW